MYHFCSKALYNQWHGGYSVVDYDDWCFSCNKILVPLKVDMFLVEHSTIIVWINTSNTVNYFKDLSSVVEHSVYVMIFSTLLGYLCNSGS